ncbi:MAG: hypothetical protein ACKORY_11425 [Actinomycetota bacterium]
MTKSASFASIRTSISWVMPFSSQPRSCSSAAARSVGRSPQIAMRGVTQQSDLQ